LATLPYISAEDVRAALPWHTAIEGIEAALRAGVDPEGDGPRLFAPTPNGEFLIMPAKAPEVMGVKVLTISPENPERGLEKIQGTYLLFDSDTSAPLCVMDGIEVTAVRTPAITLTGLRALAAAAPAGDELPEAPEVLVFGAGIQGLNHIRAVRWAWPNARFRVVGRRPERIQALIETLAADGIEVADATGEVEAAVHAADIIVTVTSSTTPLFEGGWVRPGAIVASVGQHGLDAREVDAELVLRSDVVLESRTGMFREGGNIIPARSLEEWQERQPANLREAVRGEFTRAPGNPALYTGVGMSWEDLVLAGIVYGQVVGDAK
jgi:ornithine cyclodeaminase